MKTYCDYCRKEVEFREELRKETYTVKGEEVTIDARVCSCPECGEELWVSEVDGENLNKAYNMYRKRHGLLLPEEIKQLRLRYDLSQTAFAKILGFGEKTIARYESGSIQEEAPNNLMLLVQDAYNFQKLFEQNSEKLSDMERKRVRVALKQEKAPYTLENNYYYCSASIVLDFPAERGVAS